jgi:ABC-type multidrug transport system fused ATPase/permease subunit
VLDQLNLLIKKGKVTAIVGESGSGKSTVIQLLMRYYDPTEGNIFVNGLKMEDIDIKNFRKRVGYVGQEPMLFSMSIAENLKLSNPDLTD